MIQEDKRLPLIPLIAGILLLLQSILINSITPPLNEGWGIRYLIYWLFVIISSTGTNLIALYLGYQANKQAKPWQNLSMIYFYLLTIGILTVAFGVFFYNGFSARDLWIPFVPISSHEFPLAASLLVPYILGPYLADFFEKIPRKYHKFTSFSLIIFVILLPSIFNRPLWNISNGNSFVWVSALYVIGLLIGKNNFNWIERYRYNITMMLGMLVLVCLELKLVPMHEVPGSLTKRLFANYRYNMALFSIALFGFLIAFFKIRFKRTKVWHWPNWFLLITYFVTTLPLLTYRFKKSLHMPIGLGMNQWGFWILIRLVVLCLIVGMLLFIMVLLRKVKLINRIVYQFTLLELVDFPSFAKKVWYENWRIVLVGTLGFILSSLQMLFTNLATVPLTWDAVRWLFVNKISPILLNTLIFIIFFIMLFSLINRYWPALTFSVAISILITISEYLKASLRNEPILPTDLTALNAVKDITNMVSPVILIVALIMIGILIIAGIVLQRHIGKHYLKLHWYSRFIVALLSAMLLGSTYWSNQNGTLPNIIFKAFNIDIAYRNQIGQASANGPIIQFIINMNTKIMDQPSRYSKVRIQKIMKKYDQVASNINKTRTNKLDHQTVIFVLSETFSDPNRVPNLKVSANPIPYLTSLKKKTNSGLMLSQGYGGGTANMEWQSLTGLALSNLSPTLPTPYTQLVPSQTISPAFTDLFDTKYAIHPYNAKLYNRKQVFKKFGFQRFYYQGSRDKLSYQTKLGTSPYVSDNSAYKNTIKLVKQSKKGSQFIQLSTMQNHMPFNNYYKRFDKFNLDGTAYAKNKETQVETYVQGINQTDKALKKFIRQIDQIRSGPLSIK
jgi:phosphoglycerol transferase MdoB-like AlkP superfamily enzyme